MLKQNYYEKMTRDQVVSWTNSMNLITELCGHEYTTAPPNMDDNGNLSFTCHIPDGRVVVVSIKPSGLIETQNAVGV